MKAIVLTCDKYHLIADHMISRYLALWPENPFHFRIPYQNYPTDLMKKYGDRIELVKTEKAIKATVLQLLSDFDDDDWVFWCMDDRYPIEIDSAAANDVYQSVQRQNDERVAGMLYVHWLQWGAVENRLDQRDFVITMGGRKFLRRRNFRMIWMHQYLRVRTLRFLFGAFPDVLKSAKEMDYIKDSLTIPAGDRLYACDDCIVVYGESTTRGYLTKNLASSLLEHGFGLPEGFPVSSSEILRGQRTTLVKRVAWKIKYFLRLKVRFVLAKKQ